MCMAAEIFEIAIHYGLFGGILKCVFWQIKGFLMDFVVCVGTISKYLKLSKGV